MKRKPREHDKSHLDYIRGLPCCICLDNTSTEAAHVSYNEPKVGRFRARAMKADDRFTVPLCGAHHREQHAGNERAWWNGKEIDPNFLALALHSVTGDQERGEAIIKAWH